MDDFFSLRWLKKHPSISYLTSHFRKVKLDYYVYGTNPTLFISSGMHGNEYGVISSVSRSIQKNLISLPNFIYVPIASPSAVKNKTRMNDNNQDVNRGFSPNSANDESQALMKIISDHSFDLSVSFHEDFAPSEFYMYDFHGDNNQKDISTQFKQYTQKLKSMGVVLFNGIDDPDDLLLGSVFVDGYLKCTKENIRTDNGQLEEWMINNHVCQRALNPEIPGKSLQNVKDTIVDAFFTDIIIPLL